MSGPAAGAAAAPVDLTGVIPSWPALSRRHWQSCLGRASVRSWSDYPEPYGHPPLRAALARPLGAEPDDIVVVPGLRPAIQQLARTHDRVVAERPTFVGLTDAVRATGTPVVEAGWGAPFLTAAADRTAAGRLAALVTTPWRNPDGRTLDEPFATGLAELARAGRTVVLNESYRFAARSAGASEGSGVPGALAAGSLSKVAGGGVRLGWLRGPGAVEHLGGTGQLWAHPPLVWQDAWARFIEEGGLGELARAFCVQPAAAAAAFLDALPGPVRAAVAGTGAYVLLNLRVPEDVAMARLAALGVRAGAGRDFHTGRPALRLAFSGVPAADARRAAGVFARCADLFEAAAGSGRPGASGSAAPGPRPASLPAAGR